MPTIVNFSTPPSSDIVVVPMPPGPPWSTGKSLPFSAPSAFVICSSRRMFCCPACSVPCHISGASCACAPTPSSAANTPTHTSSLFTATLPRTYGPILTAHPRCAISISPLRQHTAPRHCRKPHAAPAVCPIQQRLRVALPRRLHLVARHIRNPALCTRRYIHQPQVPNALLHMAVRQPSPIRRDRRISR